VDDRIRTYARNARVKLRNLKPCKSCGELNDTLHATGIAACGWLSSRLKDVVEVLSLMQPMFVLSLQWVLYHPVGPLYEFSCAATLLEPGAPSSSRPSPLLQTPRPEAP